MTSHNTYGIKPTWGAALYVWEREGRENKIIVRPEERPSLVPLRNANTEHV